MHVLHLQKIFSLSFWYLDFLIKFLFWEFCKQKKKKWKERKNKKSKTITAWGAQLSFSHLVVFRPKIISFFPYDWVVKKILNSEARKNFSPILSLCSCTIYFSFFLLDTIHYIYLKWLINMFWMFVGLEHCSIFQ